MPSEFVEVVTVNEHGIVAAIPAMVRRDAVICVIDASQLNVTRQVGALLILSGIQAPVKFVGTYEQAKEIFCV